MRRFLSLPALLVAVALLVGAGVGYLVWSNRQTYREAQDLLARIQQTARAVEQTEGEVARLQEELTRLEASPPPVPMPTEAEARRLSDDLLDLAERGGLQVTQLRVVRGTLAPAVEGGEALPVVRIHLQVLGPEEGLLALLGRVDGTPTAVVEALEFSRPPSGGEEWRMQMSVRVAYRKGT